MRSKEGVPQSSPGTVGFLRLKVSSEESSRMAPEALSVVPVTKAAVQQGEAASFERVTLYGCLSPLHMRMLETLN